MIPLLRRDPVRTCRGCGCDDDHACEGGCSWVLLDLPDRFDVPTGVCSACAEDVAWDLVAMAHMGVEPIANAEAWAILEGGAA